MLHASVAFTKPDSLLNGNANRFGGGIEFRCLPRVAMPKLDPITELTVEVLRLEAEVLQEESGVLLLDARAKEVFAHLARVEARFLELGLGHIKSQPLRESKSEACSPAPAAPIGPVPDDRFIDQRDGLVPKPLYLRLAREGAFPSSKIGKRVVARWGDVRAAIEARGRKRRHGDSKAVDGSDQVNLDALRRELSLDPNSKSGR